MFITSAFHRAARFGNDQFLNCLLDTQERSSGIVNKVDQLGWTALHNAALNDQEACVKLLLDHGADWRIETREGSALDIAEEYNKKSVVKLFESQCQSDRDAVRTRLPSFLLNIWCHAMRGPSRVFSFGDRSMGYRGYVMMFFVGKVG